MFQDKICRYLLASALFVRVLTAYFNPGFVAFDDYFSMLRILVPAQNLSVAQIIEQSEIRSPLPRLMLFPITEISAKWGIKDSLIQIQILYTFIGLFSLLCIYFGARFFWDEGRKTEARIACFVLGFHAMMPYLSTRVMFETLPFSFLMISAYSLYLHQKRRDYLGLLVCITFITFASIIRPQCGILFLVPFYEVIKTKSWKSIFIFFSMLSGFFATSGYLDLLVFKRPFHGSLRYYVDYNLSHSADYGKSPLLYFIPVIFALLAGPFFISSYKNLSWKRAYKTLSIPLLYAGIFIGIHSLIPHKEERFIYPILPFCLLLIVPLLKHFYDLGKKTRLYSLATLNGLLFLGVSFFPAQKNIIEMIRFADKHSDAESIFLYKDSGSLFPTAYSARRLKNPQSIQNLSEIPQSCSQLIFIRKDYWDLQNEEVKSSFIVKETFEPGPLEKLVIYLNPKKNQRRSAILALQEKRCS